MKRSEVYRNLTVQVTEHSPLASASAILTKVAAIQSHIGLWATHNPHSYANKTTLIDAERLRVFIYCHPHAQRLGPRWDLMAPTLRLYEKSIALAKAGGFTHEEALANELAARFCLQMELKREAEGYLRAAFWTYAKWGSQMKQTQLKAEFSHVFLHTETTLLSAQLQAGMAAAAGVVPVRKMQSAESVAKLGPFTEEGRATSVEGTKGKDFRADMEPMNDSPSPAPTGPLRGASAAGEVLGENGAAEGTASWDHVDTAAVMKACMAFSVETDLAKLTRSLLWLVIQTAGASRGTLLLKAGDSWAVELAVSVDDKDGQQPGGQEMVAQAEKEKEKGAASAASSTAAIGEAMPLSLFHLVLSTHQSVLLSGNDLRPSAASSASTRTLRANHPAGPFASALTSDPYLLCHRPKACLCVPILQQAQLTGLLYLANDHTGDSFTLGHVQILRVLTAQAALSIENARLYARVQERSAELVARNAELQQEMERRVQAQEAMRVAKEAAEKAAETKSSFLSKSVHLHRLRSSPQIITSEHHLRAPPQNTPPQCTINLLTHPLTHTLTHPLTHTLTATALCSLLFHHSIMLVSRLSCPVLSCPSVLSSFPFPLLSSLFPLPSSLFPLPSPLLPLPSSLFSSSPPFPLLLFSSPLFPL